MNQLALGIIVGLWVAPLEATLLSSEQELVQAAALKHFIGQHRIPADTVVCVAVSGHQSPTKNLRALLQGIKVDPDKQCHLRKGTLVYTATRVATNPDGVAELQLSKFEFDDVIVLLERRSYRLRKDPAWKIVSSERWVQ